MDYIGSVGLFVVVIFLAVQVAGLFAIVYFGARLAIRHERRMESTRQGMA